jgi:hypothetical protein
MGGSLNLKKGRKNKKTQNTRIEDKKRGGASRVPILPTG